MSWRRAQFEKKKALENAVKNMQERGIDSRMIHIVSNNADNRHYCWGCSKQKYCYETKEKAVRSTQFVKNKQRVYYCGLCMGYHTTSKIDINDVRHPLNNGYSITETQSS